MDIQDLLFKMVNQFVAHCYNPKNIYLGRHQMRKLKTELNLECPRFFNKEATEIDYPFLFRHALLEKPIKVSEINRPHYIGIS